MTTVLNVDPASDELGHAVTGFERAYFPGKFSDSEICRSRSKDQRLWIARWQINFMDNLRDQEKSVYCTVIRRQPNGICSYLCGAGDGYRGSLGFLWRGASVSQSRVRRSKMWRDKPTKRKIGGKLEPCGHNPRRDGKRTQRRECWLDKEAQRYRERRV